MSTTAANYRGTAGNIGASAAGRLNIIQALIEERGRLDLILADFRGD
jgi:hypothetical protein